MTRQSLIEKKLNCKFIRCNPDDNNFSIFTFIGIISNNICKYKKYVNKIKKTNIKLVNILK